MLKRLMSHGIIVYSHDLICLCRLLCYSICDSVTFILGLVYGHGMICIY